MQRVLSGQFILDTGRQGAVSGQHEAFPDRQNDLLGLLRPIQGLRRLARGPLRAAWALSHQQIALSGLLGPF